MIYSGRRSYTHTSRYSKYRQIIDTDTDKSVYLETFNATAINKDDNNERYHIVLPEQENRFDIIANIYYGDPSLSWVIMLANDIIDPFILLPGTTLRIPHINSLYMTGGALDIG